MANPVFSFNNIHHTAHSKLTPYNTSVTYLAQPQRFKAKFADKQGNRYYRKGRFISVYYDCNPLTLRKVDQTLAMDEEVLRRTHLRARSILDYVNKPIEKKNPYLQAARKEMELDRAAIHQRNETVEQVIEDMRTDDGS